MCCEITLHTRTIIAQDARVGPFTGVNSHMCCEMTLLTRTIMAQVACVGPFPSVNSHMCCETTLRTRTIIAEVACVGPFTRVCSNMCCLSILKRPVSRLLQFPNHGFWTNPLIKLFCRQVTQVDGLRFQSCTIFMCGFRDFRGLFVTNLSIKSGHQH